MTHHQGSDQVLSSDCLLVLSSCFEDESLASAPPNGCVVEPVQKSKVPSDLIVALVVGVGKVGLD